MKTRLFIFANLLNDFDRPGELEEIVKQVKGQLKRIAITGSTRRDRAFLGIETNRAGFIDKNNIRNMCIKQQLPCDDDIINCVSTCSLI